MGGYSIPPIVASGNTAVGLAGLAGIGGALAGAFPTPSSGTNTASTQGFQSSTGSTQQTGNQTSDLLNQIFSYLQSQQQSQQQQTGYQNTNASVTGNTAQTSNTTGTNTGTASTVANLSPEAQQLLTKLSAGYGGLTTPDLTGYHAQQIQNVNNSSDLQKQAVNNALAARGLSNSPIAATANANIEQNRINQINQVNQQIPLLKNQLQLGNLGAAAQFFGQIPHGTTSTTAGTQQQQQGVTGTTNQQQVGQTTSGQQTTGQVTNQQNQQQTQQQQGNVNTSNLTNTQGTQSNIQNQQGTFQQQQGGGIGSAIGGGISSLLSILPFLALSDERLKEDIKPVDKALEKIKAIQAKTWKWRGSDVKSAGLIAQDLEKVIPELVHEGSDNLKRVDYGGLIPILAAAVSTLDAKVSALEG